jgi:chaperonin GroES
MSVKFKPLDDRILVKRLESESKTPTGIIIPDTAKEKPSKGKVLAVGDGKMLENGTRSSMTVKVGDIVMFTKWSGAEVAIEGEDLVIMKETDVLGTVNQLS